MNPSVVIPPILLLLACGAYILWPPRKLEHDAKKTRVDYLRERKDVIYDNLRDLQFEYKAGKYPEEDFMRQRAELEGEAAAVLQEMEALGG